MTSAADSRLVLITGASSGIGLALACVLASRRVPLLLTARRRELLERVAGRLRHLGGAVEAHAVDVADLRSMRDALSAARDLGGLSAVVNNAGVLQPIGPVADTDPQAFEQHLRTNVVGVLNGMRLALQFRGAGQPLRVVNISSGAATRAIRGWGAYCASKAAVNQLTQVAALENADGLTSIVSVAPGIIETAMQRAIRKEDETRFPDVGQFVTLKDKGLLLAPVEAAAALAWLVLDATLSLSGSFVDARSAEVQEQVRAWQASREDGTAEMARAQSCFDELEAVA